MAGMVGRDGMGFVLLIRETTTSALKLHMIHIRAKELCVLGDFPCVNTSPPLRNQLLQLLQLPQVRFIAIDPSIVELKTFQTPQLQNDLPPPSPSEKKRRYHISREQYLQMRQPHAVSLEFEETLEVATGIIQKVVRDEIYDDVCSPDEREVSRVNHIKEVPETFVADRVPVTHCREREQRCRVENVYRGVGERFVGSDERSESG